jgi:glycine/D-amino acid oxidase-like deaminating enzyme
MPSVGLADGLGWAGGYVGDGVAAANLAGRTLADLIRGERTERTGLPWVGHRSRRWEPEPIRWLGINAARHATTLRDALEKRAG